MMITGIVVALMTQVPTCEERLDRMTTLAERATARYTACVKALEVATSSVALEPAPVPPVEGPTIDVDLGSPIVLVGAVLAGGLIGYALNEAIR